MKKLFLLLCINLGLGCTSLNNIYAQENDTASVDLYSLPISELMNLEVTSSTKTKLTIQKAPSIIRVFTKKDIESMGFYTLQDVLNNISGIQIQEYRAGHQLIWIRGVQQRYNNKVLLLIDGVPMRDSYYGHFNIDEAISLDMVEKIEVVNGPGSVLYGTNSFSGIISITTKKEGRSMGCNYGSFNSIYSTGEISANNFYANVNYFSSDGFHPKLNADGNARKHDQSTDSKGILLKYQDSAITLIGSYNNQNYPYKYRDSKKEYYFTRTPIYGIAKYNLELNKRAKLDFQAYYNHYDFKKEKTKFIDVNSDTIKEEATEYMGAEIFGGNVDFSYKFKGHSIILGGSYQQDQANNIYEHISYDIDEGNVSIDEDNITNPNVARSSIGIFLQDVVELNQNLLLTGGVRYDFLSDFDNQFNYRMGLTGQTGNIYSKLLYGTAFRVPSYREYLDAASYNELLQPEHLSTLEFQVGCQLKRGDIYLTLFNNTYSNFIQELFLDSILDKGSMREIDDEMAFNFKERSVSGMELNATFYPVQNLYLNFGGFYLFNAIERMGELNIQTFPKNENTGETDIVFLSDYTINFLSKYRFKEKYTIGFNCFYFGDRNVPDNYQEDVPKENADKSLADGFFKLDAFASAAIVENLLFRIKINNILDSKIYSPPYGGANGYDSEWEGITFNAGLKFNF